MKRSGMIGLLTLLLAVLLFGMTCKAEVYAEDTDTPVMELDERDLPTEELEISVELFGEPAEENAELIGETGLEYEVENARVELADYLGMKLTDAAASLSLQRGEEDPFVYYYDDDIQLSQLDGTIIYLVEYDEVSEDLTYAYGGVNNIEIKGDALGKYSAAGLYDGIIEMGQHERLTQAGWKLIGDGGTGYRYFTYRKGNVLLQFASGNTLSGERIIEEISLQKVEVDKTEGITIDEKNFPDSSFRAYVSREFDKNDDGVLSSAEREAVVTIAVSRTGIASLKGIEFFPNLAHLFARGNKLKSLDLSKNTALVEVECSKNQLTALPVGMLGRLQRLCCFSNKISKLNLENNLELNYLDCQGNGMTELVLGRKDKLETIICFDNKLSKLDVSGAPNLKLLDCPRSRISTLTLGSKNKLTRLVCYKNKISKLDVSGAPNMDFLDCQGNGMAELILGQKEKLKNLICFDNKLTKLDVSSARELEYLDCWTNKLKAISLTNNIKLVRLRIHGNAIPSVNIGNCPRLLEFAKGKPDVNKVRAAWNHDITISVNTKLMSRDKVLYQKGSPKSVALDRTTVTLETGKTVKLTAAVKPEGVVTSLKWTSSNPSVATVSSDGVVKGVKVGTATITVKTSNGKKATCKVTVEKTEETGVELSGYYGKNIHEVALAIGGMEYSEWDEPEDGVKDFYDNEDIGLAGWDRVTIIQLKRKSKYMLLGIKVGMSRSTIREKMKGYTLWGEDDYYGAQYIIRGSAGDAELLLGVSYDDNGNASMVEYGIWSYVE